MSDHDTPIVIDVGSGFIQAGFSGDDYPRVVFPAVVGRPKFQAIDGGVEQREYYAGDQAIMNKESLSLSYPIEDGVITDWDDFALLLEHVFKNQLRVDSTRHPVILTERSYNPKANRSMLAQLLFDKFDVPAMHLANSGILALYAVGKTEGIIVESSVSVTDITAFDQGFAVLGASARLNVGGRHVTKYLSSLLSQKGYSAVADKHEIVEKIKEDLCFMALSVDEIESNSDPDVAYALPDGETIMIGKERMLALEVLMQPSLIGEESPGIPELIYQVLNRCDHFMRSTMGRNIQLVGENTLFPGMDKRIQNEVADLAQQMNVQVNASPERKYSIWIGGSILSSLSSFESLWFTRSDYEEHGATCIERVCPTN